MFVLLHNLLEELLHESNCIYFRIHVQFFKISCDTLTGKITVVTNKMYQ